MSAGRRVAGAGAGAGTSRRLDGRTTSGREAERRRVHAEAHAGRARAVVEHVAEMRAARRALQLHAALAYRRTANTHEHNRAATRAQVGSGVLSNWVSECFCSLQERTRMIDCSLL